MPKHYKEMMDEIINKMDEDAPANAVAHGGVDMAPNAGKKKKKDEVPDELKKVIMKRMSGQIKEDNDNNNVVLKGVLDKLDTIDQAVDKLSGIENKVEFVEEKEHKSFKSKNDLKDWCKSEQPYYKKHIPEVYNHFLQKANL